MEVSIRNGAEILWARGAQGGVASTSYLSDGTQQDIITALRTALRQAEAELGSPHHLERVANACRTAPEVNDNVPIARARNTDPRR